MPWELCGGLPRIPGVGGFLACDVAELVVDPDPYRPPALPGTGAEGDHHG